MGCKQCKVFVLQSSTNERQVQPDDLSKLNISRRIPAIRCRSPPVVYHHEVTFENLPVELIYHIFDRLDTFTILTSLFNVCKRLNSIICAYDQYNVQLNSISMFYFHRFCSVLRPDQVISLTLSDGHENVGLVKLFLKKFRLESFNRLRSLTLININKNEQMLRIFVSLNSQLQQLTIENRNQIYDETVHDTLMSLIEKASLQRLTLDIEETHSSIPSIIWKAENHLRQIRFVGLCHLSLFRNILLCSSTLEMFQCDDIDFDEEEPDENEEFQPISNAQQLKSLALIDARNEMNRLQWFLPQLSELKSFKYLNLDDFHSNSILTASNTIFDGQAWEKLLQHVERFEFILTHHYDERWNVNQSLKSFQSDFWREKNWPVAFEQYETVFLFYSIPYAHQSHYYDQLKFASIPHDRALLNKSMENITKLRIKMSALTKQIVGQPRFPNVIQLILDGQWRDPSSINSIASLVHLSKIVKIIRLERMPTIVFQSFIGRLPNLQSLTLTSFVLDGLNAAKFQYLAGLRSLRVVQLDHDHRHFVNVEPFCTMFPRVKHLDIPIDTIESGQYVLDRLLPYLNSVVFRFPRAPEDDDDDEQDDQDEALVQWAEQVQQGHQYRVSDGDVYLWLRSM